MLIFILTDADVQARHFLNEILKKSSNSISSRNENDLVLSIDSKTMSDETTLLASSLSTVTISNEEQKSTLSTNEEEKMTKVDDAENSLENLRTKKNVLEKEVSEIQVNFLTHFNRFLKV